MSQQATFYTEADTMLHWLSHHGVADKSKLKRCWRKFYGETEFDDEAQKRFHITLKNLAFLGHVELFKQEIIVAPPTLLRISKKVLHWVGARTPKIFELLDSKQEIRKEIIEQKNAPDLWKIGASLKQMKEVADDLASSVPQLKIVENRSLDLLKTLPGMENICRNIYDTNQNSLLVPEKTNLEKWTLKKSRTRWIRGAWKTVDYCNTPGLYRYGRSYSRIVFARNQQGNDIEIRHPFEQEVLIWNDLLAGSCSSRCPLVYNRSKHILENYCASRLPFFLERGLLLHSGLVPKYNEQNGKYCWEYHVDEKHAFEVFRFFGISFPTS